MLAPCSYPLLVNSLLTTPMLQEYTSDEITITEDPGDPTHLSLSAKLNGTEVFLTTVTDSKGQKILTAKELSTPPYIFLITEVPTSSSSEKQENTSCTLF